MSSLNLFSLPPEIRQIIWKYTIGDIGVCAVVAQPRPCRLESRQLNNIRQMRMFPNPYNSTLPNYLKKLSRQGFDVPKPGSLFKDYDKAHGRLLVTGGPQPGSCRDCGKLQDRDGLAELCWECADSGISLLYTCRAIFNEAVAVLYDSTLPTVRNTEELIHYMYCVNSHGHGELVKRILLQGIIYPDRLHYRGALFPPGVLSRALPSLKKIYLDMSEQGHDIGYPGFPRGELYVPWYTADGQIRAESWSRNLRAVIEVLVQTFSEYDRLETKVAGLNCSETHVAVQKSISGKHVVEYDFEGAMTRVLEKMNAMGIGPQEQRVDAEDEPDGWQLFD